MRRKHLIGMLAGWALWTALVAADFAYREARSYGYVPKSVRGVTDVVMTGVTLAAWPVAFGGYFWVWGEGPPMWARNWSLHIVAGLVLYGALGMVASRHWGAFVLLTHRVLRGVKPRLSMRTVLWIVVVVAIFAGWMADRNRMNRKKYQRAVDALTIERAKFNAAKAELKARQWEARFRNLEAQREKDKSP